jgi:3-deoxy-D-manno-octulosonate 8-phosphate phosphatase (KDO 8-P phosphatase)
MNTITLDPVSTVTLQPLTLPFTGHPSELAVIKAIKLVVFDFDGVLTNNMVYVSQTGEEMVRCSRSDARGFRLLDTIGVSYEVLSGEVNPVVAARCKKLHLPCTQGIDDKITTLQAMAMAKGLTLNHVAYLGNDWNDAECLASVGLPVVVADAYPDASKHARYTTTRLGGNGAARELCEWLYALHTQEAIV